MNDEQKYKNLEERIEAIENEQNKLEGRLDEIEESFKRVKEKVELTDDHEERISAVESDIQTGEYGT